MPAELDDLVKKFMASDGFKSSYNRLKREASFAKKFPSLESYAFARANNVLKSRKAAAAGSQKVSFSAAQGATLDLEGLDEMFTNPRVVDFIRSGGSQRRGINDAIVITQLTRLDSPSTVPPITEACVRQDRLVLTSANADETWAKLIGKPVHWHGLGSSHGGSSGTGDDNREPIGAVIDVAIDRRGEVPIVVVASQVWDATFKDEMDFIEEFQDSIGASWEIVFALDSSYVDEELGMRFVEELEPTGMALLRSSKAAFKDMRVLAASAHPDTTDGDLNGGDLADGPTDHPDEGGAGQTGKAAAAAWSQAFMNDLPDSSFALVRKPVEDKSKDRALPYKDKNGKLDPDHVRNALSRLPQTQGWSAEELAKANRTLQSALKAIQKRSRSKGAAMGRPVSDAVKALVDQAPEESRSLVESVVEAMHAEFEAAAAASEQVSQLNGKVGELEAQMKIVTDEKDTLAGKVAEYERKLKLDEQQSAAAAEFDKAVKDGKYSEESREEIVPIMAKGLAGEALSYDEATKLSDLRVSADTAPLPGATVAAGGSARASAGALTDEEHDALVKAEADKQAKRRGGGD